MSCRITHIFVSLFLVTINFYSAIANDTLTIDAVCCTPQKYSNSIISICEKIDLNSTHRDVSLYTINQNLNIEKKLNLDINDTDIWRSIRVDNSIFLLGQSELGCLDSYRYSLIDYKQKSKKRYCDKSTLSFPYEAFKQTVVLPDNSLFFPILSEENNNTIVKTLHFDKNAFFEISKFNEYAGYQPIQVEVSGNYITLFLRSKSEPNNSAFIVYRLDSDGKIKIVNIYNESKRRITYMKFIQNTIYAVSKNKDIAKPLTYIREINVETNVTQEYAYESKTFLPAYIKYVHNKLKIYGFDITEDGGILLSSILTDDNRTFTYKNYSKVYTETYPLLVQNHERFGFILPDTPSSFILFDEEQEVYTKVAIISPRVHYIVAPSMLNIKENMFMFYHIGIDKEKRIKAVFKKIGNFTPQ